MPDFSSLISLARELPGALRSGVWLLEGAERESGRPLKVIFFGSQKQKSHLAAVIYCGESVEQYFGKGYAWQITSALRTNKYLCDIAIIEGAGLHRFLYQRSGDFFLPLWLKSCVAIPMQVASHSYKEDLRRIRKTPLGFEVTTQADKLDDFYHNMYRPTVNASHGESTIEINYDHMRRLWDDGDCALLLVTKDEIAIAGCLIVLGPMPRLWAIGVRDNDPEYLKCSAITATYHFCSEYLAHKGSTSMHLGMSRSFLDDGILRFKSKFRHEILGADRSGLVLRVLRPGPAADSFFISNPFAHLDGEKLYAAIFFDDNMPITDSSLKQIQKKYNVNSFSGLQLYTRAGPAGKFEMIGGSRS